MLLRFALLVSAALAPLGAMSEGARDIPIGSAGVLRLDVTDNLRETRPPPGSGATVAFESKAGGRLQLLLTPLPGQTSDADVRGLVQSTANRIGPESVEKNLKVQAVRGKEAAGYYFKATDPAPKPGEFSFMYQGAVALAPALVTFTVLYNEGAEKEAEAALSAIRALRFIRGGHQRADNVLERTPMRAPRSALIPHAVQRGR